MTNVTTLALTPDQQLIRDSAETFLADASDSAAVRRAMDSEHGYDAGLWQRIAGELGWCGVAIDEAYGGLGMGAFELALLFEQAGRRLLCSPLFATVGLAVPLLQAAGEGPAEGWLRRIAAGELRLGVNLPAHADWRGPQSSRVRVVEHAGGWTLDGELPAVVDGASAESLLVLAQVRDATGLFVVDPAACDGLQITPLDTWDRGRRLARVGLRGVVARERIDAGVGISERALERAAAQARVVFAAEQLGNAQSCLDLTVAYVAERKQFGRPIAGFQAVKHRCAEMMVRIEALRSAVYAAATTLEPIACAGARALAADTAFWCAQEAIQLHGGVGFTWEYDPQLYFKRAQAAVAWLGRAEVLRESIAQSLLATSAPAPTSMQGFRAEVADWMRAHLVGRFETLRHRGGPGDEEFKPALRKDWERELAAGGWTCVGWPLEHGGRGLSIEQQVIFHEEYARAGGPGRMGHIGEGLIGPALIHFGNADQQRRFLPDIVAGRRYWAQGYSEPNAGSDLANVQTRCWRDEADGSWRVQGQKIWTSLAHESDWIFVLARCEPGSKGGKGLAFLLLPLRQPGIEIRPIRQIGGGREFNEVFFDGARAAAEDLVGAPGEGWKVAMGLLEAERGVSTLGQQMHFAQELDRVIAAARRNGLADDPMIRQRLAQAAIGLQAMRGNALRMLDGGADVGLRREALIGKYFWSNWHRDLGKLAMDVLGDEALAVSDDPRVRPLQQLFFFSRADTIYAGSNEIQLNLIAERGLGMPREARPAA
ncbi:MAG: acyl-CoA dehydrogenase [Panacagrimonas sp.]|nr:acyl-CoA dehydrogenase [Panacagrimonas sp.]MCC2657616.1 acyl-CoA dehydrogenase [Panacagrimonas sp.]